MRALVLLVVVVLAFAAVHWFNAGSKSVDAADESTPAAVEAPAPASTNGETQARFLAPPPALAVTAQASVRGAEPVAEPVAARAAESWPKTLVGGGSDSDEVALAATLIHGTPAEVQAAAALLSRDRALLLESFAWAVAGERQVALSLSEKISSKDAVEARERALFEAAILGTAAAEASASSAPVPLAMEMALAARDAKAALEAREYPEAARSYSELLVAEIGAPWPAEPRLLAEWTTGLDAAQREHRWNPRSTWPGTEMDVQSGDTLIALRLRFLAQRPDALMCTGLIERANRLKGFLQPGQKLRIPTDPVRVLVDLQARWALYFLGDEVAAAWPVGIGRPGEDTPPGDYTVRNKLENPPWMKEGQEPIPFGDPRNPLGTRWIGWSREGAKTSYGFHGTWEPESIGHAASDGCVRLLNADVERLFQILPEGAPIRIQG